MMDKLLKKHLVIKFSDEYLCADFQALKSKIFKSGKSNI